MAHRSETLALYRRCLRTAFRCASADHQQTWAGYTRLKFREGRSQRDKRAIQRGLADALEQTERLEYYQNMSTHGSNTVQVPMGQDDEASSHDRLPFASQSGEDCGLTAFIADQRIPEPEASLCKSGGLGNKLLHLAPYLLSSEQMQLLWSHWGSMTSSLCMKMRQKSTL
jgi:hypothetical protein